MYVPMLSEILTINTNLLHSLSTINEWVFSFNNSSQIYQNRINNLLYFKNLDIFTNNFKFTGINT